MPEPKPLSQERLADINGALLSEDWDWKSVPEVWKSALRQALDAEAFWRGKVRDAEVDGSSYCAWCSARLAGDGYDEFEPEAHEHDCPHILAKEIGDGV